MSATVPGGSNTAALINAPGQRDTNLYFPVVMIAGVYRSGTAMGVNWFSAPSIPETKSRYRTRLAVRAARQSIVASLLCSRQRAIES